MYSKVLEEFSQYKELENNNSELEIRFGKFGKNFDSSVNIDFFYRLKKYLKLNNKNYKTINAVDSFYESNIRCSESENIKKIITKNSVKYHNDIDYDIRIVLTIETPVKEENLSNPVLIRKKNRTSWCYKTGNIDLTEITEIKNIGLNNEITSIRYEIEYELNNKTKKHLKENINEINGMIVFLLQIRQDNFYLISNTEYNLILNNYKQLVKNSFFVGIQPVTLQQDSLKTFYNNIYSVTYKTDGDRFFLYITKDSIYLIDNNLRILKTNIKICNNNETLIDGELIRKNGKIYFEAFDILFYNTKDLRGNMEYNLYKRLDILNDSLKNVSKNEKYIIKLKQFIFKNVFLGAEIFLNSNSLEFKVDGLIFTPINDAYPLSKAAPNILKWKPKELNTIDFYSVKKNNIEKNIYEWELYVLSINNESKKLEKILFTPFEMNFNNITTFRTSFSDSLIDYTTMESFKTNTVIEYKWDYNLKKFIPLKTRWDKTMNPSKHGNFSSVACSIWNNIMNSIEISLFYKLKNLNIRDDISFKNMKIYHDKIKEELYKTYTYNTQSLIELCVGRGSDLHKLNYNKISKIFGYDISDKNLKECIERSKKINSCSMFFYKLDLSLPDSHLLINKHTGNVSNISCQFSLHYFFESQNILDNFLTILDSCLDINGCFMVTYMDSKKILELMNDKNEIYSIDNGNIMYYLKKININKSSKFGNKIKIYIDGNNILNESSEEFLIDSDFFIEYMDIKGYECIQKTPFNEMYKDDVLSDSEKTISFLNTVNVFKKKPSFVSINISKKINSMMSISSIREKSIITNFERDISLIKITDTFNFAEFINSKTFLLPYDNYNINFILNYKNINILDKNTIFNKNNYLKDDNYYIYNDVEYLENNEKNNIYYFIIYKNNTQYILEEDIFNYIKNRFILIENQEEPLNYKSPKETYQKTLKEIPIETLNEIPIETIKEIPKVLNMKQKINDLLLKKNIQKQIYKNMILEINTEYNIKLKDSGTKQDLINILQECVKNLI